ncbi:helix-turn-helix domain-containing protein [Angustibacter luteus]|uniref:Tetratricopeptide repeat protein n=1 Tax=Angustibacter luteus TaxID=658456 RepID=A0ABW1JGX7_9ACTN
MTTSDADVGARLRALRTGQGLTQRELAGDRYTTAFVSSIEAGRRQPSSDALEHFANQLGVDPEVLRDGRPSTAVLELALAEARHTQAVGDTTLAREQIDEVLGLAIEHELPVLRSQALVALGFWALRSGDVRGSLAHYEEAEKLLVDQPEPARALAVAGQARCLRILGDVRRSVMVVERALDELERAGLPDPLALMVLHAQAVPAYMDLGLSRKAEAAAETALGLAAQVPDPLRQADMYRAVARGFLDGNRVPQARQAVARAQELYDQLDLRTDVGHCYWARGWIYEHSATANLASARRQLETARQIFIETGSRFDEGLVTVELADIVRRLGAFDRARALIADIQDYPEVVALPGAYAEVERCLGLIAADEGEYPRALTHLERAIALFRQAEELLHEARTYRHLGDVRSAAGDADGATRAYRDGLTALDRVS